MRRRWNTREHERKCLEHFRAKWLPVRVKKMRQNKNLELGSDSIRTAKALVQALYHAKCGPKKSAYISARKQESGGLVARRPI